MRAGEEGGKRAINDRPYRVRGRNGDGSKFLPYSGAEVDGG
jgi:hypothetical protein